MSMIKKEYKYNEKEQTPLLNIGKIRVSSEKYIENEKTSESTKAKSEENNIKENSEPVSENEYQWIINIPKKPKDFLVKKIGSEKASESTNTNSKESKNKENSEPASENKTQLLQKQKEGKEEDAKKNSNLKKKPIKIPIKIPINAIREEFSSNECTLTGSTAYTTKITNLEENQNCDISEDNTEDIIVINEEPAPLEEKNKKKEENQQNSNQKTNSVQKENDLKDKDKNILNIKNNKNIKNGDLKDKINLYSDPENKTQLLEEQKNGKEEYEKKNSNKKEKPNLHIPIDEIRKEQPKNDSTLTVNTECTTTNLEENKKENKKKEENQQNSNQKINSVQKENDLKNKDKIILNINNKKNIKNGDIKDKKNLYSDYENDNFICKSYTYDENHLYK